MNAKEHLVLAEFIKSAGMGNELAAGGSGLFGPLGAYLFARVAHPNSEHARSDIVARNAIGASIGGLAGSAAGIPISMATGVPFLPGMLLGGGLGMLGGGIGAGWAEHRHQRGHEAYQQRLVKRREKLKKLKQRRDPDNIEES